MSSFIVNSNFIGAAGDLTGYTDPLGATFAAIVGRISLSGSGTIYNNPSSGTTSQYICNNKFATTMAQTFSQKVDFKSSPTTEIFGPLGWSDASFTKGYVLLYQAADSHWRLFVSPGLSAFTEITSLVTPTVSALSNGDIISLRLSTGQQQLLKNGSVIATFTDTTYTPTDPSIVFGGMWLDGLVVTGSTGVNFSNFSITDDAVSSLVAAAPEITSQSKTSVTLSETPSGGTPAYTYQWYKSTTPNFTAGPGNIISGATGSTVTISVTGTRQFVRCIVQDANSDSSTSFQRMINAARDDVITIIRIGDSTSLNPSPTQTATTYACLELRTRGGYQNAIDTNMAVTGSATANWLPGQANMIALDAAVAACATRFIISIGLGVNDDQNGVSTATFSANMASIIAHVLALTNSIGATPLAVFLDYPTWREPGYFNSTYTFSEDYSEKIWDYADAIDALVNGTSVLIGNTKTLNLEAQYPYVYMINDGDPSAVGRIHPNQAGSQAMGFEIADAIWNFLYPSTPGSDVAIAY